MSSTAPTYVENETNPVENPSGTSHVDEPPVYISNYDADFNTVHPEALPPAYPSPAQLRADRMDNVEEGRVQDANVGGFTGQGTFTRSYSSNILGYGANHVVDPFATLRRAGILAMFHSEECYNMWWTQTRWIRVIALVLGGLTLIFCIVLLVGYYRNQIQTTISLLYFFFAVALFAEIIQGLILATKSPFDRWRDKGKKGGRWFRLFRRGEPEGTVEEENGNGETVEMEDRMSGYIREDGTRLQLDDAVGPVVFAMRMDGLLLALWVVSGFVGPTCVSNSSLCFLASTARWLAWIVALVMFVMIFADARGVRMMREAWI